MLPSLKSIKYLFILFICIINSAVSAQNLDNDSLKLEVVQVSGLVVTGDSLAPLPYTTVYRLRDQRGTMTDPKGFFSIPALAGDTLRFSITGYLAMEVIIPSGGERNRISLIQPMSRDTVMINNAYIYPWPSRERFKQEFMDLGLEDDLYTIGQQAISPFDIYDRLIDIGLDGQAASSMVLRQMALEYETNGQITTVNILNPVAWGQFLQALRNGDLRRP